MPGHTAGRDIEMSSMRHWGLDVFRAAVEAYAEGRVLGRDGSPEIAALVGEADGMIRSMGMQPLSVLRVNSAKARCVTLCSHPVWGRCVHKSVSMQGPQGGIYAHVTSVALTGGSSRPLFPRVHAMGRNFTVEQFIDGTTLHELSSDDWARVDLLAFFERLREFRAPDHANGAVMPAESAIIVCKYVRKIIVAARYAVPRVSLAPMLRLCRNGRFRARLQRTLQYAAGLQLPRTYAFDDLTPGNVVLSRQSRQPYIVDVEHVKEGFFGFDCLWMLAMLTRTSCPVDTITRGYKDVCTEEFCEVKGADDLMRSLFALLLDVLGVYVGSRSRRKVIWGLRDLALSDIRSATNASLPAMAGGQ